MRRPDRPTPSQVPTLGSVRADEVMPSAEFRRRMGVGVKGCRTCSARAYVPSSAAGSNSSWEPMQSSSSDDWRPRRATNNEHRDRRPRSVCPE